jgi:hypothetical protein
MKRLFSTLIVLGLLAGLLTAAVGTASAQIAPEAQLGFINGASTDAVSVTVDGSPAAENLVYADLATTVMGAAGSYGVSFSDGSFGVAVLGVGEAATIVSGYGNDTDTAKTYPIEVAPIAAEMAKYNVTNATSLEFSVSIDDGVPQPIAPGASLGVTTVAAGIVTVVVLDTSATVPINATVDSYTDAFIVNDGSSIEIALAIVPSMTKLIADITPPSPTLVEVPDVVGQPQADAELTIAGAGSGLRWRSTYRQDLLRPPLSRSPMSLATRPMTPLLNLRPQISPLRSSNKRARRLKLGWSSRPTRKQGQRSLPERSSL